MALQPTRQFHSDPLQFMRDNIVIVPQSGDTSVVLKTGIQKVCFYWYPKGGGNTGFKRDKQRTEMDVFYIGIPGKTAPTQVTDGQEFAVYFCPYESNAYHGVVLGNECSYMLTTQMDGCSLGVGSRTNNGEVLVFHANAAAGNKNQASMQKAQKALLKTAFLNEGASILGTLAPSNYLNSKRGTNYASTTFGLRDAGNRKWSFYAQRFSIETGKTGFQYGWKEVKKIV
jgi:hypothetical protein